MPQSRANEKYSQVDAEKERRLARPSTRRGRDRGGGTQRGGVRPESEVEGEGRPGGLLISCRV